MLAIPAREELEYLREVDLLTKQQIADFFSVGKHVVTEWIRKNGLCGKGGPRQNDLPSGLKSLPFKNEMSWAIGFLYADGNLYRNNHGNYKLGVAVSTKDMDILDQIQYIFDDRGSVYVHTPTAMATWSMGATRFAEKLKGIGIHERKSKNLSLPKSSLVSMPDFFRGLFDGDGCWHIGKERGRLIFNYATSSEKLIFGMAQLLGPIIKSAASPRVGKDGVYRLIYAGNPAIRLARYTYKNRFPSCDRKLKIVEQFI